MIITLCGSTAFFDEIKKIKQQLTRMGHKVYYTTWENLSFEEVMTRRSDRSKYLNDYKPELVRAHFDKILKSDAILVVNLERDGIKNYIGGNTFAEIMFAYYYKKKIFFLNPIPKHEMFSYIMDELETVKPIVINGNLDLIKIRIDMKDLTGDKKLVYPAFSKRNFFWRMHISKFVLEKNCVPVNPFMNFEYFLLDTIDRDLVRNGNNNIIKRCDEVWVFGEISDGVLKEIELAKSLNKNVKFFDITNLPDQIKEIPEKDVKYEVE